jgi:hypothetical protein
VQFRHSILSLALCGVLFCFAGTGCATYSDHIESATVQVNLGNYPAAMEDFDSVLGVSANDELPDSWGSERPLAVLERGVLLQAVEDYAGSARDLSAGETELELLDFKHDTAGQIGKYVYSDSSQDYETPPTERLALNAVNMLNYLALADWSGASTEARRFTVMREYLESVGLGRHGIFGSYLAGLTFERLGQGDRALRYYEEAMADKVLPSLRESVERLAASNPYRGPRIRELLAGGTGTKAAPPSEIVTVLSLGRVPKKVPERMPVGAAIGIAGTFITGNPEVLARSAFKVVVYPDLKDSGSLSRDAVVEIDGNKTPVERVSSTGRDIRKEYERLKPRIIAAALTRMLARALAAEGARVAGQQAGGAGAVIGLLAALGTEAALVGLDRPDTRSWTMLPDHVLIARTVVTPGKHTVKARVTGPGVSALREFEVDVPKGQAVVVVVTEPR